MIKGELDGVFGPISNSQFLQREMEHFHFRFLTRLYTTIELTRTDQSLAAILKWKITSKWNNKVSNISKKQDSRPKRLNMTFFTLNLMGIISMNCVFFRTDDYLDDKLIIILERLCQCI